MVIFAVTTTGGGEILAVTSIVINDIYSVYIHVRLFITYFKNEDHGTFLLCLKPYKPNLSEKDSLMCILCEKMRGQVGIDKCTCCSITYCKACDNDNK